MKIEWVNDVIKIGRRSLPQSTKIIKTKKECEIKPHNIWSQIDTKKETLKLLIDTGDPQHEIEW